MAQVCQERISAARGSQWKVWRKRLENFLRREGKAYGILLVNEISLETPFFLLCGKLKFPRPNWKSNGLFDCHRRVRWQLMRWALPIANTECADELCLYSAQDIAFMNVRRPKHSVGLQAWGARSRNAPTRSEISRKKTTSTCPLKSTAYVHAKKFVNPGVNTAF